MRHANRPATLTLLAVATLRSAVMSDIRSQLSIMVTWSFSEKLIRKLWILNCLRGFNRRKFKSFIEIFSLSKTGGKRPSKPKPPTSCKPISANVVSGNPGNVSFNSGMFGMSGGNGIRTKIGLAFKTTIACKVA